MKEDWYLFFPSIYLVLLYYIDGFLECVLFSLLFFSSLPTLTLSTSFLEHAIRLADSVCS